ncbi:MAG: epoxyqueuosine reductase [Oscillospiraceae bacterium]|nr:epoxyqueuosine reductase [Oscillospiraceae bacterium]
MTREKLQKLINDFSDNSTLNYLSAKGTHKDTDTDNYAKNNMYQHVGNGFDDDMLGADEESGLIGMRFYRHPVFAIARADDPMFEDIKRPEVVGKHHLNPTDWLSDAKSVITFFLPFNHDTVEANKKDPEVPAIEWVCTRVDGQRFLLALGTAVRNALIEEGYTAVAPYTEDNYIMQVNLEPPPGTEHVPPYSTNWSERHVGVVTGLGTFGQSTNFISKIGCAGRLISVVTSWEIPPDEREYGTDWLGYCNDCGLCIKKCKGNAYYPDRHGKDHALCSKQIRKVCEPFAPRYGCGKCQSGIPCEYTPRPKKGKK